MKNLLLFAAVVLSGCIQTENSELPNSQIQKSTTISAVENRISENSFKAQGEKEFTANIVQNTIIWEGDSRVDENMTPEPPSLLAKLKNCSYIHPANVSRNLKISGSDCKVVNIAQSGDTAQAIRASELAQGDAYAEGKTIYILDAGGNDTGISGRNAATIFADLQQIERAQTAKGYTVYLATIADGKVISAARAKIPLINKLIRSNYPANRIIDFARDQKLNNFKNTTYFRADGIHYTNEGKNLRAAAAFARFKEIEKKSETK